MWLWDLWPLRLERKVWYILIKFILGVVHIHLNLSLIVKKKIGFLKCMVLGPLAPLPCENAVAHLIKLLCEAPGPLAPLPHKTAGSL